MSVRRKVDPVTMPPREWLEINVERWALTGVAFDDPWRPTRAHGVWRAARAAWVEAGGVWPGGESQRLFEEAASWPDEPWDGSLI